jgi:hypothetical protein
MDRPAKTVISDVPIMISSEVMRPMRMSLTVKGKIIKMFLDT